MKKVAKKTTEKYVTEKIFKTSMTSITQSFKQINALLDAHTKLLQEILKEIRQIHLENKEFKKSMSSLLRARTHSIA